MSFFKSFQRMSTVLLQSIAVKKVPVPPRDSGTMRNFICKLTFALVF